jgi:hypothetical protein
MALFLLDGPDKPGRKKYPPESQDGQQKVFHYCNSLYLKNIFGIEPDSVGFLEAVGERGGHARWQRDVFYVWGCYKDIEYMMIYLGGAVSDCDFRFWHKCCKEEEELALKKYICKTIFAACARLFTMRLKTK